MEPGSTDRRERTKLLRTLLAITQEFQQEFQFKAGDETCTQQVQEYMARRASLLAKLDTSVPPTPLERRLAKELRHLEQEIEVSLRTHRDEVQQEMRQVKQQKKALNGYRRQTRAPQQLRIKG